tara:strand:- start:7091 stop:7333 length:243 start_codon:yes stop_codon:yes gene_type:complete
MSSDKVMIAGGNMTLLNRTIGLILLGLALLIWFTDQTNLLASDRMRVFSLLSGLVGLAMVFGAVKVQDLAQIFTRSKSAK